MKFSVDQRFTMAPESLLFLDGERGVASQLSDKAYRLYHVLWAYADRDSQRADITRSALAAAMGCSAKTIDRSLIELERFGAIEKAAQYTTADRQTSNAYVVITALPALQGGWTLVSREGDTHVAPGGDTHVAPGGDTHVAPIQEESLHQHSEGGGHARPVSIDGVVVHDVDRATSAALTWAAFKNVPLTRSVKRKWLPIIDDFLATVKVDPAQLGVFLQWATENECREPSGWPYWWAKWPGAAVTPDVTICNTCENRRYVGVNSEGIIVPVDTPDSMVMRCLACSKAAAMGTS